MPILYTLQEALEAVLLAAPATVDLQSGVIAQLTRYEYYAPYVNDVNPQLNVPIIYFNIVNGQLTIGDTAEIGITNSDIFDADDWIILNARVI